MIYFAGIRDFGNEFPYVKIGYSKNVNRRIAELQAANPFEVYVIGVICGDRGEEASLHNRFQEYQYRNEWYHLSDEIKIFIKRKCNTLFWKLQTITDCIHALTQTVWVCGWESELTEKDLVDYRSAVAKLEEEIGNHRLEDFGIYRHSGMMREEDSFECGDFGFLDISEVFKKQVEKIRDEGENIK